MTYTQCCKFLASSGMIVKKGTKEIVFCAKKIENSYNGEWYPILMKFDECCFYLHLTGKLINKLKENDFNKKEIACIYYKINPIVNDCMENTYNDLINMNDEGYINRTTEEQFDQLRSVV